jgi:hypothetical protein
MCLGRVGEKQEKAITEEKSNKYHIASCLNQAIDQRLKEDE